MALVQQTAHCVRSLRVWREEIRLHALIEIAKIESAERQSVGQMELERKKEQFETVRVLAKEHLIRERTVKDFLTLVADNTETQIKDVDPTGKNP